MTLRELAAATGARWTGAEALLERAPADVATDSRQTGEGSLFVAFRGERTDGHRYIPAALRQGALAILCEEAGEAGEPRLIVPEVFAALRAAAAYNRARCAFPFIGVTGSVGKTTAKEMLAAVLAQRFRTFKTPGSMNGQVGVPIALLSMRRGYDAAVIEMGISLPGEMRRIGAVVRPDMGVFLNIGDAHLEALRDHAGILREKEELLCDAAADAPVFINGDDELLKAHDFRRPTIRFGLGADCDVRAGEIESADGGDAQRCVIAAGERRIPVYIPAYGTYMVYAALAAAAVALYLGESDAEIAAGIAAYETVGHRSRVLRLGKWTLIDDCYNANPTSNRAAIDSMANLPGRRVCILGDMREMGESSPRLHRELGRYAAEHGAALLLTQGEEARFIAEAAPEIALHFSTKEALLAALPALLREGDLILVKASHGAHFEEIADAIERM